MNTNRMNNTKWKLRSALLAGLCVLGGGLAAPASAQFMVLDASNLAENVRQVTAAMDQINNQRQQIEYQLQALRRLNSPRWGDIAPLLQQLDALMRQSRALGYSLADIDRQFVETFPGWQPAPDNLALAEAQRMQAERTLGTMRAALNVLSEQGRQFAAGQQLLASIKAQMSGIEGTQGALELQATLDAFAAEELGLQRQMMITHANLQAVHNAYVINREAESRATYRAMMDRMSELPPPSTRSFSLRVRP
jgi:P-type conjugative transfer protein TrbJ